MSLKDLMVSKVRIKLLQTFFSEPKEIFYVRQLVRRTGEEINAVRRELKRMEKAGMVQKEPRGNRLYYWFNKKYPFYNELIGLVAKTTHLGKRLLKKKNRLGRVKYIAVSGRLLRGLPPVEGGVDLLVVGEVMMPELARVVQEEEKRLGRELNYTVMTREEFEFRKKRRDPFLQGILAGSRTMIYGDEEEMTGRAA
jgi:hypothetical protein